MQSNSPFDKKKNSVTFFDNGNGMTRAMLYLSCVIRNFVSRDACLLIFKAIILYASLNAYLLLLRKNNGLFIIVKTIKFLKQPQLRFEQ